MGDKRLLLKTCILLTLFSIASFAVVAGNGNNQDESPIFSPDGSKIAWKHAQASGYPSDHKFQLVVMDSDGSGPMYLIGEEYKNDAAPRSWSPDSSKILYAINDGVENNEFRIVDLDIEKEWVWAPFGSDVNYFSADWGDKGILIDHDLLGNRDIWLCDEEGDSCNQLTDTSDDESAPVWSPDGKKIAYLKGSDIYIMDSDGSDHYLVKEDAGRPLWLDSETLIYYKWTGSYHITKKVNIDGTGDNVFADNKLSDQWATIITSVDRTSNRVAVLCEEGSWDPSKDIYIAHYDPHKKITYDFDAFYDDGNPSSLPSTKNMQLTFKTDLNISRTTGTIPKENPLTISIRFDDRFGLGNIAGSLCGGHDEDYDNEYGRGTSHVCDDSRYDLDPSNIEYDNKYQITWLNVDKADGEYVNLGRFWFSPNETGRMDILFDKKITIDMMNIPDDFGKDYHISLSSYEGVCVDSAFGHGGIFYQGINYGKEYDNYFYLPDFTDNYAMIIGKRLKDECVWKEGEDPPKCNTNRYYIDVELKDGDIITADWSDNSIKINGKEHKEETEDWGTLAELRTNKCYLISQDKYYTWDWGEPSIPDRCLFGWQCEDNEYCDTWTGTCMQREIQCHEDSDCGGIQTCSNNVCIEPNVALILYPGDDSITTREIESIQDDIVDRFAEGLELDSCQAEMKVLVSEGCEGISFGACNDATTTQRLENCYVNSNPYLQGKKVILLGISTEQKPGRSTGLSCGLDQSPHSLFVKWDDDEQGALTSAHEMGHAFGLLDQYCYNPPGNKNCPRGDFCDNNPTDPRYGGDDPSIGTPAMIYLIKLFGNQSVEDTIEESEAYCKAKTGYKKNVLGNKWDYPKEGRSIMGATDSEGPKKWGPYDREHLNNHEDLQCWE